MTRRAVPIVARYAANKPTRSGAAVTHVVTGDNAESLCGVTVGGPAVAGVTCRNCRWLFEISTLEGRSVARKAARDAIAAHLDTLTGLTAVIDAAKAKAREGST